jgi:phage baseplate assembly protein V
MYKTGIVSAVDEKTCRARVKFAAEGGLESYWLQVLQGNTFANKDNGLPDVGEAVAVLLDDKGEAGCVLGAYYDDTNKPPSPNKDARRVTFSDGSIVEYDRVTHKMKVHCVGDIEADGVNVKVTASAEASVQANTVHITGATTVTGTSHLDGNTKVGGGSKHAATDEGVKAALDTLKNAISSAPTVPQDGGAAFKAGIVSALGAWPPSMASSNLTTD